MGAAPLTTDSIGKTLRALRDASGLTGDSVARRASMSAGKLSRIENGRVLPTVQDVDLEHVSRGELGEFLVAGQGGREAEEGQEV
ncbi:helix-turn-helix domain-containing protein, partial [Streptomyces barkulensis]|uniref:helix-turn-helix domain-containing protein n=1 Tax=Streptomyces barkulensis TaxID=1257026 RepID=UPI001402BDD9